MATKDSGQAALSTIRAKILDLMEQLAPLRLAEVALVEAMEPAQTDAPKKRTRGKNKPKPGLAATVTKEAVERHAALNDDESARMAV